IIPYSPVPGGPATQHTFLLVDSAGSKMAGIRPHTMPQGPIESTLTRLDAIFMEIWRRLEERRLGVSKQYYSPPAAEGSMPDPKRQ
ncbi:Hypothetical predicted protein, partial [Pelobates cultripes]